MQQLFVMAGGKIEWGEQDDPEISDVCVGIETKASGVSVGTEMSFIRRFQNETEGRCELGYSAAGVVTEIGPVAAEKTGLRAGSRVACYGGPYAKHATRLAVPWTLVAPIPDPVSFEEAAFCGIGAISMHSIRRGAFTGGERVLVMGMGILGQLEEQMLRAWGCRTMAVDRHSEHLDLATKMGCRNVFDTRDGDMVEAAMRWCPDGVDGAILNTSLQPPAMDQAAAACRECGRIVMVGGGKIEIGRRDVFAKEIDLLISRAGGPGRYDAQYERDAQDLPAACVRWTEGRNIDEFVQMVAAGQIDMNSLITHRFPRQDAAQAFALLGNPANKYSMMGVVFTYDEAGV